MNEITVETKERLEQQMIEQFCDVTCNFDLAVTLTFTRAPTGPEAVERDFRHFMNRLNRATYGNDWREKAEQCADQRIAVIPIHEDGYGRKQLHYHCVFSTPEHLSIEKFSKMILFIWSELRIGSKKYNEIKKIYDREGWIDYIMKEVNLLIPDNNNKIDALNMHTY